MPLHSRLFLVLLLTPVAAEAQLDWRATAPGPNARFHSPMVVDPTGPGLLLYGGYGSVFGGFTPRADMHRWYRGVWQTIASTNAPGPRFSHGLAADLARQRVVLFGGSNLVTFFGDTWEWDGRAWTQLQPWTGPSPRSVVAMTYDPARSNTVLFGGASASLSLNDTWTWSGSQWTQMTPTLSPPYPVTNMVFDEAAGVVVVAEWTTRNNFEWDGSNWRNAGGTVPAPGGKLAYDSARQRVVWYGGTDPMTNFALPDAWERTGTTWVQRLTARTPSARSGPSFLFDPDTRQILCYGGHEGAATPPLSFGDAWLLGPVHPAATATFGTGCPGSGGTPQLAAQNLPWLGDSLQVGWINLPSMGAAVLLALGNSNQNWGAQSLPLALGPTLPGCQLLVSLDAYLLHASTAPALVTPVPVPANPALAGLAVFLQGCVFDAAANPAGLSVTQGIEARLGAR